MRCGGGGGGGGLDVSSRSTGYSRLTSPLRHRRRHRAAGARAGGHVSVSCVTTGAASAVLAQHNALRGPTGGVTRREQWRD